MASLSEITSQHWESYKRDCSGYARSVFEDLYGKNSFPSGQANDIHANVSKSAAWWSIGSGEKAALIAEQCIKHGNIVLATSQGKAGGHGHVAVVTGVNDNGAGPFRRLVGSWGSLSTRNPSAVGAQNKTINYSWGSEDFDNISFYCRPLPNTVDDQWRPPMTEQK